MIYPFHNIFEYIIAIILTAIAWIAFFFFFYKYLGGDKPVKRKTRNQKTCSDCPFSYYNDSSLECSMFNLTVSPNWPICPFN